MTFSQGRARYIANYDRLFRKESSMKLSDLNPGDVFKYLDGNTEFLKGTFQKLNEDNCYIRPIVRHTTNFIVNTDTGMIHQHADYRKVERLFAAVQPATLIIDGKTIKLSAETTAELKKKLGV